MTDSQLYPLNLYLINNVKVIVFFLGGKGFNLNIFYSASEARNPQV